MTETAPPLLANDRPVTLTEAQLQALLDTAAERGAKKALAAIGLCDAKAAGDVRDLREVLDAFRLAKTTAWTTIVRVLTAAVLAAVIAGVGVTAWPKN